MKKFLLVFLVLPFACSAMIPFNFSWPEFSLPKIPWRQAAINTVFPGYDAAVMGIQAGKQALQETGATQAISNQVNTVLPAPPLAPAPGPPPAPAHAPTPQKVGISTLACIGGIAASLVGLGSLYVVGFESLPRKGKIAIAALLTATGLTAVAVGGKEFVKMGQAVGVHIQQKAHAAKQSLFTIPGIGRILYKFGS